MKDKANSNEARDEESKEPDQRANDNDDSDCESEKEDTVQDGDPQDQNYHFYKEYCRLYYANIILTNRL